MPHKSPTPPPATAGATAGEKTATSTTLADALHAMAMNTPANKEPDIADCGYSFELLRFYRNGHRDARHALASDLASDPRVAAAGKAEGELARLTTPQPIEELHEDDGEVLCVHWDEHGNLGFWECTSSHASGFDRDLYTHFYPLANLQPPAAYAPPSTGGNTDAEETR